MAALGGVCLGIAFTCHYNMLPWIMAVFIAEALRAGIAGEPCGKWMRRLLFIAAGGLLVFAAVQIPTWLAEKRLAAIYPKFENYLEELIRIVRTYQIPALGADAAPGEGRRGWGAEVWAYAWSVARKEGILGILAPALGMILAIHGAIRRRHESIPLLVFGAIVFSFWALHPWKVERSWGMLVLAAWIVAGIGWADLANFAGAFSMAREKKALIVLILATALMIHALDLGFHSWGEIWRQKSPLPGAARAALAESARTGARITAASSGSSFAPLWKWTLIEEGRAPNLSPGLLHADFSSFAAPDLALIDPKTWAAPGFLWRREETASARLIYSAQSTQPPWRIEVRDMR